MDIFKTESRNTMRILLGAGILMGALSISGICMSVIAKLNRNMHRYGIEIMNGQSLAGHGGIPSGDPACDRGGDGL